MNRLDGELAWLVGPGPERRHGDDPIDPEKLMAPAAYVARIMNSLGTRVSTSIASKYLKRTEQYPKDVQVHGILANWFIVPGHWGKANRAVIYSRIGTNDWQEAVLRVSDRTGGQELVVERPNEHPMTITQNKGKRDWFVQVINLAADFTDSAEDVHDLLQQIPDDLYQKHLAEVKAEMTEEPDPSDWHNSPQRQAEHRARQEFLDVFFEAVQWARPTAGTLEEELTRLQAIEKPEAASAQLPVIPEDLPYL